MGIGLLVRLLGFFGLNISETTAKVLAVVGVIALVGFGLYQYRESIKAEVYQQFYAEEVERKYAEQQKQIQILQNTVILQQESLAKAVRERQEIAKNYAAIANKAKTSKAQDGAVAPVLKDALDDIRKLQEGKTNGKP